MLCVYVLVCFFKQKTAYEMRISDWSSDVCSSDLERFIVIPLSNVNQSAFVFATNGALQGTRLVDGKHFDGQFLIAAQSESRGIHDFEAAYDGLVEKIGSTSCRERVCQYV